MSRDASTATSRKVPSTASVLATLIGVTWRRLFRGRAVWICLAIAGLPSLIAVGFQGRSMVMDVTAVVELFVIAILPPVFVAASLGEEIEEHTTTYLWSRPLPRWTMVIGKLVALAPIATLLCAGGWIAAIQLGAARMPPVSSIIAFSAGALAIATMSAGLATLVPRHGMALSIVYLVIFDIAIGAIPAALQNISITHHVLMMSGLDPDDPQKYMEPAIAMAIIAGLWLAIGLQRVRRLEA